MSVIVGCDRGSAEVPGPVHLFVAASLADVAREIADQFETSNPEFKVVISQGPSGRLFHQIAAGAPCDLFIPADAAYVSSLVEQKFAAAEDRRSLASNQLVLIVPHTDKLPTRPGNLGEALSEIKGAIAIASPDHAPAGQYAVGALIRAGLLSSIQPRLRFADDVRFAARYVAEGAVDGGFVYLTDAIALKNEVTILYRFVVEEEIPIRYDGIVIGAGRSVPAARRFLDFAASSAAAKIWRHDGFGPPLESKQVDD